MTIQQLLYFRAAAEHGSFNAAARRLHCTQPAVSDQVRRLELELGVSLFARTGRGLTLTSAGRVFLGHAERVTEAADDALLSVGRAHAARERVLTIGTFRNSPYYEIAGLIERHAARYPDARVRMRGQNSSDVAKAVQSGELEAGLVVLPVDDSLLDVRLLFRDEVVLVAREVDRLEAPVTIATLADLPLILYDASHGFDDPTRRQLARRAQEAGVTLEPRVEVEHVETALQLVARGLGVTIVARAVLNRSREPTGTAGVGFDTPFYDYFAIVTRRGVRVSPATLGLLELVEDWAAGVAARLRPD